MRCCEKYARHNGAGQEINEKNVGSGGMRQAAEERKRTLIFINLILTCVASSMLMTALVSALPAVGVLFVPKAEGEKLCDKKEQKNSV